MQKKTKVTTKRTPVKRDYMNEAFAIHAGDRNIKATKEHVRTVVEGLIAMNTRLARLQHITAKALKDKKEKKDVEGLN